MCLLGSVYPYPLSLLPYSPVTAMSSLMTVVSVNPFETRFTSAQTSRSTIITGFVYALIIVGVGMFGWAMYAGKKNASLRLLKADFLFGGSHSWVDGEYVRFIKTPMGGVCSIMTIVIVVLAGSILLVRFL
jgi:hypothetical protein